MPPLFRKEVLEAQRQRLHGDVLIATPLSVAVVTGWLLVTLLAVGTFAFLGTYARTERVPGYLVPSEGLVKVAPPRSGVLRDARARVREEVEAGQVLAVVQSEAPSLAGDTAAAVALQSLRHQERLLQRQIRLEQDRHTRERSRLQAVRNSLNAQIASFEEQRELQREITRSARSAFDNVHAMLEGGFISVAESERRRQAWLVHHLEEKRQARQLTELRARLTDVDHQLAMFPQEVALLVSRLDSQLADIEQREAELEGRRAYVVKAPVAGDHRRDPRHPRRDHFAATAAGVDSARRRRTRGGTLRSQPGGGIRCNGAAGPPAVCGIPLPAIRHPRGGDPSHCADHHRRCGR